MSLVLEVFLVYLPTLICIPISIYGNIRMYYEKNAMYMQKRALSTTFGMNIVLMISMITTTMTSMSMLHFNHIALFISTASFFACWWCLLFYLTVKNWYIYFKDKWTYYTLQLQWQQIINSNIIKIKNEKNWYIHNNKTYGNLLYIYKLFGIIYFISFIICTVGMMFMAESQNTSEPTDQNIYKIIAFGLISITVFPSIIFYIVIVCKTPSFNDIFHIHWESKMHSKILMILGFLCILTNAINIIIKDDELIAFAVSPLLTLSFFAMIYISTFKVIYKNQRNHDELEQSVAVQRCDIDINIYTILTHKKAINLFMKHLSKEFSMECLLSFIEIAQFQQYLLENSKDSMDDIESSITMINLPSNIPISSILTENEENEENEFNVMMNMKAHKLYNKYVKIGSEFEINISSKKRNKISKLLQNVTLLSQINITTKDLILSFEIIKLEMIQLLNFALIRFKTRYEFNEIYELFNIHQVTTNQNNVDDDTLIVYQK